ncbi:periplasmic heavy metal sensor [Reichenbachiella versicolor]|uniref:periplasmic heavy metal sensor n=1 Tax=Reichenbachiella versicolor TaxID=1821036 RepID=UPI000D6E00CA|nr:periplasmic heavy metal sensor [Reichenbachiella versicolor]
MKSNLTNSIMIIVLLISTSAFAKAQRGPSPEARKKLEAAKIGLISERLMLTPEQAQKFWPIYNEYSQKRRANHEAFRKKRREYNPETASDSETKDLLTLGRETKKREFDLDKEYSERMLSVIDSKQLLSLHQAERDFKEKLLRHLEQRRKGRQGNKPNEDKQKLHHQDQKSLR